MKNFFMFTTAILFLTPISTFAIMGKSSGGPKSAINYTVEPIVGYETSYRLTPTPHTSTSLVYGARLIVGAEWLSGEVEYTQSEATENFTTAPEKVVNKDEKVKLGLRSTYSLSEMFFVTVRGGGQASKNIEEVTTNGSRTTTTGDIKYLPYAGLAAGLKVAKVISVSLGATMVFRDVNDMSKNDIQHTLSVGVGY